MKKINLFVLILVLQISCQEHKQLSHPAVSTPIEIISTKSKINTQPMAFIDPEKVKNWSFEQIKEKYKPIIEEEYLLNEAIISEFRIELYNYFNEKERDQPILIKEVTWEKDNDTNFTIWYKKDADKWVFINSFIWEKDWMF
ncbi:hypothetical protein ETU10_08585 [Apibacter muscae]|uniref:hypothetical protein n=1 Tax=Apibacter muscae TaxID=2509004 RepID=UPI0011AC279D|nr:hypothetical protein [Apibacter muscae]TWP23142.1 hypothetical protein ETU10_08585 [Apibacter muscae]